MSLDVMIVNAGQDSFVQIPASVSLAILLPTARWTPLARSIIGSMVGVATEEIAVLVADNSENPDKLKFLQKIRNLNPNVIAVAHEKNIGALSNFIYLHDWCKNVKFSAIMADDDWMSPGYHPDAYRALLDRPHASSAAAGTTFVDIGDCNLVNVNQRSMCGNSPIQRMSQWNGIVARVTMYNTSRRDTLEAAIQFIKTTPLNGLTLLEDLWELSRLGFGDFVQLPGPCSLIHYPAQRSISGDETRRVYESLYKEAGLSYPFVFFGGLSTAIQCAVFLMGNLSPIADGEQRAACGQQVFRHLFTNSFLPGVSPESSKAAAATLFANHPEAWTGFKKYCNPPFSQQPYFDKSMLDWFIDLIKVFETKTTNEPLLSERFLQFVTGILPI